MSAPEPHGETEALVRLHLGLGWLGLCLVAGVGLLLEAMHALKAPIYLDVDSTTTRLMWRLGHAHAGALSLASLGFAFTVKQVPAAWRVTSRWLLAGMLLLPLGFLLGGIGAQGGDPSLGIVLVPPGAACFAIACLRAALTIRRGSEPK